MFPRNQDSDPALTGGADDAVEEARNIQEMDEAQEPADEGVGAEWSLLLSQGGSSDLGRHTGRRRAG